MKNNPSKLLLALTMCFSVAAVHAEGDNNNKYNNQRKDNSSKSTNVKSADSCTTVIVPTQNCGPVQKTTCTSTNSTNIDNAQKNKDTERHKDDGKDRGDGKDHNEKDHGSNSQYDGRDSSKDDNDGHTDSNDGDTSGIGKPHGYHWEQNNGSGNPKQRKVTICHREGGARTTIDVDDDGKYHGHNDDLLDTEGACEDQDDKTGKHTDSKNSGRDVVRIHKDATCGAPRVYQYKGDDHKNHAERKHEDDKNSSSSKYSTRDSSKDDKDDSGRAIDTTKHRAGYRWEHKQTVGGTVYKQRKVTICHRMGNARVTIDVDDDGWFHGHDKHPMDTEGRCEDQNDTTHQHTDSVNNGKPTVPLATEPTCAPTTSAMSGSTQSNPAACATELNTMCAAAGVSCTQVGTGARPNRGGVRNMR